MGSKKQHETKNGRKPHSTRKFQAPEDLLEFWNMYKAEQKEEAKNWGQVQYVGRDGDKKTDYPILPLTLEGFKTFCWHRDKGSAGHYFENKGGYYDAFAGICSHIRTEIRSHQITGGLLGVFNPSITQRLNNLKEQIEETNTIKVLNIDPLADPLADGIEDGAKTIEE